MLDRKEEDSPRKFRPPRINFEPKSVPGAEGSSLLCENTSSGKVLGRGKSVENWTSFPFEEISKEYERKGRTVDKEGIIIIILTQNFSQFLRIAKRKELRPRLYVGHVYEAGIIRERNNKFLYLKRAS